MWREFRKQKNRLKLLRGYTALLTHSEHMIGTFRKEGISAERLFKVPFPVRQFAIHRRRPAAAPGPPWRLLFLGRLDPTKGGQLLLEALPLALENAGGAIEMTFAGAGPERRRWETRARELVRRHPQLKIEFLGWVPSEQREALLERSDLLVFSSIWPEPFGMAGAEAARSGLPVAGFELGGVSEWLRPGETGWTAPGNRPSPRGLADAIVKGLMQPLTRPSGDRAASDQRFTMDIHLASLLPIFRSIVSAASTGPAVPQRPNIQ